MASPKALITHISSRTIENVRNEIALRAPDLLARGQKFIGDLRGFDKQARECASHLQEGWSPLVFLHVPKCGGTSASSSLAAEFSDDYLHLKTLSDLVNFTRTRGRLPKAISLVHLSLDFFPVVFGDQIDAGRLKVFAITRDPYQRFVSLFHYMRRHRYIPKRVSPEQLLIALKTKPIQPDSRARKIALQFAAPQTSYFGSFTNVLQFPIDDLDQLGEAFPFMQGEKFPKLNQSLESQRHEISGPEARLLEKVYARDFAELGYQVLKT